MAINNYKINFKDKEVRQVLNKTQLSNPKVSITGAGIVSSIAQDALTFTKRLQRRHTGIAQSQYFTGLSFPLIAAEVKDIVFEGALTFFRTT